MGADPARDVAVAVLGGGPAGSSTALTLRRLGVGVLLVEAKDYRDPRVGESLPPEARRLLERLGVWEDFVGQGHVPCPGSCSVWGSETPGHNDYLLNPHGHGWHLDRRRLDSLLARRAESRGAELWLRSRLRSLERRRSGGFRLCIDTERGYREVRAQFVVDATGSGSRLARILGAKTRVHDRLSYAGAFFPATAEASASKLTWLEAVPYGWWYAARLPGDRWAVALASDPQEVNRRALFRPERWRAALAETRNVKLLLDEARESEPALLVRTAPSSVLDPPCGPGWAAVGDAAASYDPISAQGIYRALQSGSVAGEAIGAWLRGRAQPLDAYAASVRERFASYLEVRNHLYGLETRWPAERFWRRRHSRVRLSPSS